jgi:hypothetical protein
MVGAPHFPFEPAAVVRYIPAVMWPRHGKRARRLLVGLAGAALALLALAPAAMAADGVGLYGRTDDKVVTFFAFGVMAFFTIMVIALSLLQIRLDNRKERRKQDLERLGR